MLLEEAANEASPWDETAEDAERNSLSTRRWRTSTGTSRKLLCR